MEHKSLAREFRESQLFDILDHEVVKDAKEEDLMEIVELAKCCLSWSGRLRPTMKEVARTLEMIIKSPAQVRSSLNKQEEISYEFGEDGIMSQMSDDGFMSSPLPDVGSSLLLYTHARPLLHDTLSSVVHCINSTQKFQKIVQCMISPDIHFLLGVVFLHVKIQ